jgi:hypothetical protein
MTASNTSVIVGIMTAGSATISGFDVFLTLTGIGMDASEDAIGTVF